MSFVLADRLDDVLATAMPEEFHLNRHRMVKRTDESTDVTEIREPAIAAV